MAIAQEQLRVTRSWPGVTNGQIITVTAMRARRLIALGMARPYKKPGRKPKLIDNED